MKGKRIITGLLSLTMVFATMLSAGPLNVMAAPDNTYDVSSYSELAGAINDIKNSGAGSYTISLGADIKLESSISLTPNSGTTLDILGNGHTLDMNKTTISIYGNTVNLGSGSDTIVIDGGGCTNDNPGIFYIKDNGHLVINDGVTIQKRTGNNYFGGALTIGVNGIVDMNGGTIRNCGINGGSVCFGGGVAVIDGGIFNLNDGIIKDCFATTSYTTDNEGLIPSGAGGGVFVGSGSTFNMKGGQITACSASETGGGVFVVASSDSYYAHKAFGYLDSVFNMDGGEISGCSADYYGGGIAGSGYYVNAYALATHANAAGTPSDPGINIHGTVRDNIASAGAGIFLLKINNATADLTNAKIYNNKASAEGSDIYLSGIRANLDSASKANAAYTGLPSDVTGKTIGRWCKDYSDERYADANPADRVEVEAGIITADNNTGDIELIAVPSDSEEAPEEVLPTEGSITLKKLYKIMNGYTGEGDAVATDGIIKEAVTFTIKASDSFNREIDKTDIPEFSTFDETTGVAVYTINVGDADNDEVVLELPDYSTSGVGDYWYAVKESSGNAAGVTYDDNTYYLHVMVTREDTGYKISSVTLHISAPSADGTYDSDKTDSLVNRYGAGKLVVTKKVKGNMSDLKKAFDITVTFTAPEGKNVTGDIRYNDTVINGGWTGTTSVTVPLKADGTVEFSNIPDGVTYKVTESDYSADGYDRPVFAVDEEDGDQALSGENWSENYAAGTISDSEDSVNITNNKEANIDVGVNLKNSPFIIMLAFVAMSGIIAAVAVSRRKKLY